MAGQHRQDVNPASDIEESEMAEPTSDRSRVQQQDVAEVLFDASDHLPPDIEAVPSTPPSSGHAVAVNDDDDDAVQSKDHHHATSPDMDRITAATTTARDTGPPPRTTYTSPFSPHFDFAETAGPTADDLPLHINNKETFYEATADMHLLPREKKACYVDALEIVEDHFGSSPAPHHHHQDGRQAEEEEDVCLMRREGSNNGVSADFGPRSPDAEGNPGWCRYPSLAGVLRPFHRLRGSSSSREHVAVAGLAEPPEMGLVGRRGSDADVSDLELSPSGRRDRGFDAGFEDAGAPKEGTVCQGRRRLPPCGFVVL